jgi:hypothetical protein
VQTVASAVDETRNLCAETVSAVGRKVLSVLIGMSDDMNVHAIYMYIKEAPFLMVIVNTLFQMC